MRRLLSFLKAEGATSAIEFAFVAPVMLLMAAGITEIGRYYAVYDAANRLADQYASAWADCSDVPTGTCATELSTFIVRQCHREYRAATDARRRPRFPCFR